MEALLKKLLPDYARRKCTEKEKIIGGKSSRNGHVSTAEGNCMHL